MNIQDQKIALAAKLLSTQNKSLIKHLEAVFKEHENDLWDEMPLEIKKEIKKAKKEVAEGKGIPHKQVMAKYKKWLSK